MSAVSRCCAHCWRTLPHEDFLYLGDTARLPYGTKSAETVARYSVRAAESLVARGIKALVVACNTASASALPALRERFPDLPVIGVIEPGARAACESSASGRIAVLATEGTVHGGAYERAIHALRPDAQVTQVACQIFVALAEEGWSEGEAVDAVTERYLAHLDARVDTVVLGCTHFPLLTGSIVRQLGVTRRVVDSAATTARAAAKVLGDAALAASRARPGHVAAHGHRQPGAFCTGGRKIPRLVDRGRGGRSNRPLDTFHKAVTLGAV